MSDIDWPTELRKIEREYEGLPPEPSPAEARSRREIERRVKQREEHRAAVLGASLRLLLVIGLGAALDWWPYPRACGPELFAFMAAESMLVVGGLWVAACTWRCRAPKTHVAAMAVTLWGLVLLGAEVLPRVGYAKVDPANPPRWTCEGGPKSAT